MLFAVLIAAIVATPTRLHARGTFDLSVTITDAPDPVAAGSNITYTLTITNLGGGPGNGVNVITGFGPAAKFVSMSSAAGWTVTNPPVGVNDVVIVSKTGLFPVAGSQVFTLVVSVTAGTANGTIVTTTAAGSTTSTDANPANNSATTTTTVTAGVPTLATWQLIGLLTALLGVAWLTICQRQTPLRNA